MFAYVGCYTTPDRDGRGDGIRVYRLNDAGESWTEIQTRRWPGEPLAVHPAAGPVGALFRAWRPKSDERVFRRSGQRPIDVAQSDGLPGQQSGRLRA